MDAIQVQAVTAHQQRIKDIDAAIKQTEHFLDRKAFLLDSAGKKVLMSIDELYTLRAEEEMAIQKELQQ